MNRRLLGTGMLIAKGRGDKPQSSSKFDALPHRQIASFMDTKRLHLQSYTLLISLHSNALAVAYKLHSSCTRVTSPFGF